MCCLFVDLTTVKVDGVEALLRAINSGLDLRVVGTNSKNNDSSRGHAVLALEIKNEHTQTNFGMVNGVSHIWCQYRRRRSGFYWEIKIVLGKLAFIDLAGSERGADAMFSGKQTQ